MAFSKQLVNGYDGFCKMLDTVTRWGCISLVLVMTAEVILGVFFRYFLDSPLKWGEELARLLLVWCGLLGVSIALKDGEHLGLEFFTKRLQGRIKLSGELICYVLVGMFLIILLYWGCYVSKAAWNTRLPALQIRWTWSYLAIPVTAGIQLVFLVQKILVTIIKLKERASDMPEQQAV